MKNCFNILCSLKLYVMKENEINRKEMNKKPKEEGEAGGHKVDLWTREVR